MPALVFHASQATGDRPPTDLVCVHGADHSRDASPALDLSRRLPGAVAVAVAVDSVSSHNVQHAAFQGGRLTALFAALLRTDPIPVRASDRGRDAQQGESLMVLDLPAHRPDAPPVWARPAGNPRSPATGRLGILRIASRRETWSINTRLRWRVLKQLALRIRLTDDRATRLEGFVYRRTDVVLRFARR
jgi:hypothetical protein